MNEDKEYELLRKFDNRILKTNPILWILMILIIIILLTPRIPIIPAGFGELSIRIDGVISVLIGLLIVFLLKRSPILIIIAVIGFLYIKNLEMLFLSLGLFFQVTGILALPLIFTSYKKLLEPCIDTLVNNTLNAIVLIAALNVILALAARFFLIEICADSTIKTGCLGAYGLLDRPYIFSIFIGSGFVALCLGEKFLFFRALILLVGLFICDSRSIAAIMFLLGLYVYIQQHTITKYNLYSIILLLFLLFNIVYFSEGKMSFSTVNLNQVDPSWQMRLDSIEQYFEWVDLRRFFIGDGALAFYQFSEQYGQPGPIDNLYFRMLSEIGFVGVVLFAFIYISPLYIKAKILRNKSLFFAYLSALSIISVFQESLITPRAGHVLVLLGICIVHQRTRSSGLVK